MKKQTGITMIALIVTIIVLLILAGVTIVMVFGEEGVITKSQQAKTNTNESQEKEMIVICMNNIKTLNLENMLIENEEVKALQLQEELAKHHFSATVTGTNADGTGMLTVLFQSGNRYEVTQDGKISKVEVQEEYIQENGWYVSRDGTILWYEPESGIAPEELTIPNKVKNITITKIGDYALDGRRIERTPEGIPILDESGNPKLLGTITSASRSTKKIIIPEGIEQIGKFGLTYCTNAQEISVPSTATTIQEGAFFYCSSLQSIVLPNGLSSVKENLLGYCDSLTSITIPNSVTSIDSMALTHCISLTNITIPNNVTYIGGWAFGECYALTTITLSNTLQQIDFYSFWNCTSLTSITIPNSVTNIDEWAFADCNALTTIYFKKGINRIPAGQPWGATNAAVTEIQ